MLWGKNALAACFLHYAELRGDSAGHRPPWPLPDQGFCASGCSLLAVGPQLGRAATVQARWHVRGCSQGTGGTSGRPLSHGARSVGYPVGCQHPRLPVRVSGGGTDGTFLKQGLGPSFNSSRGKQRENPGMGKESQEQPSHHCHVPWPLQEDEPPP